MRPTGQTSAGTGTDCRTVALHAMWNALLRLEHDKDRALVAAIVAATLFAAGVAGVRWGLGEPPFASLAGLGFTGLAGAFEAAYFATLARAMDRR